MKRFSVLLALLAVFALVVPAPAAALVNLSYSISTDLTIAAADLACNCTIQIFVEPNDVFGPGVFIDLPPTSAVSKWNPIIMIGANNQGAFTVTSDGVTILDHFTTRGTVGHNAVAERWVRLAA